MCVTLNFLLVASSCGPTLLVWRSTADHEPHLGRCICHTDSWGLIMWVLHVVELRIGGADSRGLFPCGRDVRFILWESDVNHWGRALDRHRRNTLWPRWV